MKEEIQRKIRERLDESNWISDPKVISDFLNKLKHDFPGADKEKVPDKLDYKDPRVARMNELFPKLSGPSLKNIMNTETGIIHLAAKVLLRRRMVLGLGVE